MLLDGYRYRPQLLAGIPSRGVCSRRISIATPPIPTISLLMVSDYPIG